MISVSAVLRLTDAPTLACSIFSCGENRLFLAGFLTLAVPLDPMAPPNLFISNDGGAGCFWHRLFFW